MPDEQMLFLLTNDPRTALLHADQQAVDQGVIARSALRGVPVLISGGSFAYRTSRRHDSGAYESGVYAHGPAAEEVADRYVELLRQWADNYHRRGAASIRYLRQPVTPQVHSSGVITKRHGTVIVTWP